MSQFSAKKISFTFTVYLRVKVDRLRWDIFNQYGLVPGGGQEEGVEGEGGGGLEPFASCTFSLAWL